MMYRCLLRVFPIAVLTLSVASYSRPSQPSDAVKKQQDELKARDLKKLQGKWVVVSWHTSGYKQKSPRPKYWTFKDSTFNGIAFTIDTSRRPKLLTYNTVNAVNEKVVRHYIYTFDDEHLLLGECDYDLYQGPPRDFCGPVGLWRLERVKE